MKKNKKKIECITYSEEETEKIIKRWINICNILLLLSPWPFLVFNHLILKKLHSDFLDVGVFSPINIPYLIGASLLIIWIIYLAIGYKRKPNRIFLALGGICLFESIFFIVVGSGGLYFSIGQKSFIYIILVICIYIFNFIFNSRIGYIFAKESNYKNNQSLNLIRILVFVISYIISRICPIIIKINYIGYIDEKVSYNITSACADIGMSYIFVTGVIAMYEYIFTKK